MIKIKFPPKKTIKQIENFFIKRTRILVSESKKETARKRDEIKTIYRFRIKKIV